MPKIVDHEARRKQVAEIAATLIAQRGLEGTKVRDIAALAGCSTSIVSHYFHSKHELLLSAYRLCMERTSSRVDEATGAGLPLADELLAGVLPRDEERMDSGRRWLAFWGLATADEAFLIEQRQRSREAVDLFHRAILSTGRIAEGERSFLIAQALLSAAAGIATQAVYDPERWPANRQREILALHIASHLPQS